MIYKSVLFFNPSDNVTKQGQSSVQGDVLSICL